jgi:hypothetical protein
MDKKYKLYALVGLLIVAAGAIGYAAYIKFSQDQSGEMWAGNMASSTQQILVGAIQAIGDNSLTMSVVQPLAIGTTSVTFSSSTIVSRQIAKSPIELAAAYEEFKKSEAASGGGAFTPPDPSTVISMRSADLRAGDWAVITLVPDLAPGNFVAQGILVVPAQ